MDVTARVLGPLEVVVDGIDVTPRAPKEQALLATLVLRARQVVPADRLCEELWPGLDGDKARHALHVRVGCVRKLLAAADAASILQRVPPGYRLDVDAASLDERRFLALVEQARADLMGNEPAAALTSLDAADRLDQPFLRWQATLMRAHCALLAGDTSEAEARAIEALDIGTRSGQPDADIIFAGQIAGVNMQRGVFPGDTVAVLQQLRVQLPGYRDTLAAVLAWEHARLGRVELAQELLDEFGASGFEADARAQWLALHHDRLRGRGRRVR